MASLTDTSAKPYLYVVVRGLGPNEDSSGVLDAYRWCTADPGFGADWLPWLVEVPSALESELDPVTGEVSSGQLTFGIVEGAGSAFMTDLLATRERSKVGELAAAATAAAATIDVTRVVGGAPTVDQILSIGSERMQITSVTAGGGAGGSDRLGVSRGHLSTTATKHDPASDFGDAEVRYRAHYLKGRRVELFLNFIGDAEGSAVLVGTYLLDRIEFVQGARWNMVCRSVEAYLDTEIGRHAWTGTAGNPFANSVQAHRRLDRETFDRRTSGVLLFPTITAGADDGLPSTEDPFDLHDDAASGGYARLGECIIEYDRIAGTDGLAQEIVEVTSWEVAGTPLPSTDNRIVRFAEVFPTDKSLTHTQFKPDPNGAAPAKASDHPIDVFLCLLMSTGLGTNTVAGRTNYDVLPGRMWAGMPAELIDLTAWEDVRDTRLPTVRVPNLVFLYDGPENLKAIATEKLLGPLGIAAVQSATGLLTPVVISEVYPADTTTSLGTADIVPGTESFEWGSELQVLSQLWEFDHDGPGGPAREIHRVISPEARERFHNADDRPLVVKAEGMTRASGASATILNRAGFIRRHFLDPPPIIALDLNWPHMNIALGSPVILTHAAIPNPSTGSRGVTAQGFVVIKVRRNWQGVASGLGNGGGVRVWLFWVGLDSPSLVHIAPSAEVAAGDAGAGTTVTVEENSFTDGEVRGAIPADDTDGFQAGGVGTGVTVILLDSDGVLKSANTPRVTSTTATTLVLSDVFRDGVGVEVARAQGDIVIYSGDTGATSYTVSAWFAHMFEHAAFADDANGTIGTTARINHYGD